jgi:hypothetical protein
MSLKIPEVREKPKAPVQEEEKVSKDNESQNSGDIKMDDILIGFEHSVSMPDFESNVAWKDKMTDIVEKIAKKHKAGHREDNTSWQ